MELHGIVGILNNRHCMQQLFGQHTKGEGGPIKERQQIGLTSKEITLKV